MSLYFADSNNQQPEDATSSSTLPINRKLFINGVVKTSSGVWMYDIGVTGSKGVLGTYIIRKRFNDFKKLHQAISEKDPTVPSLPDHGFWSVFFASDPSMLQRRVNQLQLILEAIQKKPILRYSDAFTEFLGSSPFSIHSGGYVSLNAYGSQTQLSSEIDERCRRKSSKSLSSRKSTMSPISCVDEGSPSSVEDYSQFSNKVGKSTFALSV